MSELVPYLQLFHYLCTEFVFKILRGVRNIWTKEARSIANTLRKFCPNMFEATAGNLNFDILIRYLSMVFIRLYQG